MNKEASGRQIWDGCHRGLNLWKYPEMGFLSRNEAWGLKLMRVKEAISRRSLWSTLTVKAGGDEMTHICWAKTDPISTLEIPVFLQNYEQNREVISELRERNLACGRIHSDREGMITARINMEEMGRGRAMGTEFGGESARKIWKLEVTRRLEDWD